MDQVKSGRGKLVRLFRVNWRAKGGQLSCVKTWDTRAEADSHIERLRKSGAAYITITQVTEITSRA